MLKTSSLFLSAILALTLGACNKSDDSESGEGGKPASGKAAQSGGGDEEVTLEQADGLKARVPAGAQVGDAIGGDGAMVQAPGLVVTVEKASDSHSDTVEAAKEDAEMYSPSNVETEELDDGWVLTYENTGSMGANYFVNVRREIDGTAYWCSTTASQKEQQANAVAFCKSLSK